MRRRIADLDTRPPTPGEAAMAETSLQLALRSGLATETIYGAQLTWTGLHALAALAAMLDEVIDALIAEGYGNALLASLTDTPSRAFAVITVLEAHPHLARQLLADVAL